MDPLQERARASIREISDFPEPGVGFKDITPLLLDASLFAEVVQRMADGFTDQGVDVVLGIESRGFIFAAPIAVRLGCGFAPARKPGKLPYETIRVDYQLEYGMDALEAHADAIRPGQRILVIDDVLATGGTAAAAIRLAQRLGGTVVGAAFLVELGFLNGRQRLGDVPVRSLVVYP